MEEKNKHILSVLFDGIHLMRLEPGIFDIVLQSPRYIYNEVTKGSDGINITIYLFVCGMLDEEKFIRYHS